LKNSPKENLFLKNTANVHVFNISILAPSNHDPINPSHNTDAIDIVGSVNVLVEHSYISVGKITSFTKKWLLRGAVDREGACPTWQVKQR
jgi:hypothetical protein